MAWTGAQDRRAALAAVEGRLGAGETGVELLLARADLLAQINETGPAQAAYLALLAAAPDHLAGLNNFAALALRTGHASAARSLYARAAECYPHDPMSQANLGSILGQAGDWAGAEAAFTAAVRADAGCAAAHRGLARLAARRGERALADRHLAAAFAATPVIAEPYFGAAAPIDVLVLISGVEGDIPLRAVLDPARFRVFALAPQAYPADADLPPHQVVFNAIGDADLCGPALEAAERLLARISRPVINPPDRVRLTGRAQNARRLAGLEGVRAAASVELSRAEVLALDNAAIAALGLSFPLAVRALGFHTGQHFERAKDAPAVVAAVAAMPGDAFVLMDFLDTRSPDGLYRKHRAVMVGGALFPLHLAVSRAWKVHYFTADMTDQPAHRAEDAAFLADMPGVIGAPALAALGRIQARLGLDYGGIDFALTPAGEVVVFEANATMVVQPPPPEPLWDYRREPTAAILAAAQAMIAERAGR